MERCRRLLDACLSEQLPGTMSSYWGIPYFYGDSVTYTDVGYNQQLLFGAAIGPLFGGAADIGDLNVYQRFDLTPGNTVTNSGVITDVSGAHGAPVPILDNGDTCQLDYGLIAAGIGQPTELSFGVWYHVMNANNTTHTFELENPATPGVAFPSYTFQPGSSAEGQILIFHHAARPPTSSEWNHPTYAPDYWAGVSACLVSGFTTNMAEARTNVAARGNRATGKNTYLIWDPDVVAP